jgi:hypothetical protein
LLSSDFAKEGRRYRYVDLDDENLTDASSARKKKASEVAN